MDLPQYLLALKRHDWNFAFSDDGSVYRKGAAQRRELSDAHAKLDPNSTHWNAAAPPDCQRGAQ